MKRNTARLQQDVKSSVVFGIILSTIYAVFAILVFTLNGSSTAERYGVSLIGVLSVYYSAGILGGLAVGLLKPLSQSLLGSLALRLLVAGMALICGHIAMYGWPSSWSADKWEGVAILTAVFAIGSFFIWSFGD